MTSKKATGKPKLLTSQGGHNSLCGFVPSVLSRPDLVEPNNGKALGNSDSGGFDRLFLISDKGIPRNNNTIITSAKKTKNRKWISRKGTLEHNETTYQVNASKSGIFPKIMNKAIDQLDICLAKWGRVFVLRFDLHQVHQTKTNQHNSRFRKNLNRKIERHYGIGEVGFLWVREQEKAKAQHYHWVIYLDGNKIRHSSKLLEMVKETWEAINPSNHVPTIKKPFYFVDNDEIKHEAIYRISYLAKSRGKGYREKQVKDYSSSRLIPPKQ